MAIFPGLKDLKESIVPQPARHIELPDHYDHHPGDDHKFIAKALKLAEKGRNTTHPNPRVGCVITRNGVLVGKGYHEFAGEPHAEINALKDAGRYANGGTMYVNLEPCCHQGRTPPCTDSIIKAGINRVVIAMEDPNPLVNRAGISALQKAGIVVETGINHERAIWLNRGFVRRITQGTPWVTLKIAISLDGKTAMENGESHWITSDAARQDAHRVRAENAGILTGIGTVLRDNPKMTARTEEARRQPLRIILDSRLSTPADAAILEPPGQVLIITAPSEAADAEIFPQSNVEVISCQMKGASIDLQQVMLELGRREINNLMLEAGSRLSGAMLQQGLVDELVVYMAPDLLGSNARGMFRIPGLESIEDKYRLDFQDVRQIGRDLKLTLSLSDKRPRVV